ncbi:hypothetical protein KS4_31450 [Poriferisphaera corsica]|uniref:Uncharacterized protein n=1 Tax=Poriferisphaera corsica TaxID=2528020 RepID=A0A517YXZ1_9BACT|nr:hypothetical protein [Poriferisphaera corsica]QDU35067.1 hypothetical protein KS4_31450 [Poriferisphaera corsica]
MGQEVNDVCGGMWGIWGMWMQRMIRRWGWRLVCGGMRPVIRCDSGYMTNCEVVAGNG